jgi:hypothetical protein
VCESKLFKSWNVSVRVVWSVIVPKTLMRIHDNDNDNSSCDDGDNENENEVKSTHVAPLSRHLSVHTNAAPTNSPSNARLKIASHRWLQANQRGR